MRQIGTLPNEDEARRLSDHLTALGMSTRLIPEGDGWALWVHHEDHVPQARQELEEFRKNPDDPRYQTASQAAQEVRRQAEQLDRRYRKNVRDLSGHWDRTNFRGRPLTITLIAISVAVFVLGGWDKSWNAQILKWLRFTTIVQIGHEPVLSHGLQDIVNGQVWRLITPIFLHFDILHILFNMWWMRDLGTIIEYRRGTKVLALLVFLSAIASNTAEYTFEAMNSPIAGNFGGMSGVVYALFGYVWMKGRQEPEHGMMLHPMTVQLMLIWLVFCMLGGSQGHVANVAHVVGLIVGMLYGLARF